MDSSDEAEPKKSGELDERTTERRIPSSPAATLAPSQGMVDSLVSGHLAEAKTDVEAGRFAQARTTLEMARSLEPDHPKVQDLLAYVSFRQGRYDEAIALYEKLRNLFPGDSANRVNLALAYLRANRVTAARSELEEVVRANPGDRRAWGYLGIALERLGFEEQSLRAFARAQIPELTTRGLSRGDRRTIPVPASILRRVDSEVPRTLSDQGFAPLDAGGVNPLGGPPANVNIEGTSGSDRPDAVSSGRDSDGPITSVPPASSAYPGILTSVPPSSMLSPGTGALIAAAMENATSVDGLLHAVAAVAPASRGPVSAPRPPPPPSLLPAVLPGMRWAFPPDNTPLTHPSGVLLISIRGRSGASSGAFAARAELIRSFGGKLTNGILERTLRGKATTEPLGGYVAPFVRFDGTGRLIMGPKETGEKLLAMEIGQEPLCLREDALGAFDLAMGFETRRLALDEEEGVVVVELRGSGCVVLRCNGELGAVDVHADEPFQTRLGRTLGWMGQLVARPLSGRSAPAGQRGFVTFEGTGVVLMLA